MADAIQKVAKQFPNTKFGIIDHGYSDDEYKDISNVLGILYKEHEGSFLIGVLAALTTETNTVGFVGGMDIPVIHRFEAGYKAGVWKSNRSRKPLPHSLPTSCRACLRRQGTLELRTRLGDDVCPLASLSSG